MVTIKRRLELFIYVFFFGSLKKLPKERCKTYISRDYLCSGPYLTYFLLLETESYRFRPKNMPFFPVDLPKFYGQKLLTEI